MSLLLYEKPLVFYQCYLRECHVIPLVTSCFCALFVHLHVNFPCQQPVNAHQFWILPRLLFAVCCCCAFRCLFLYLSSVLLMEHHFTPLVAKCCLFYLECCGFEKIFFTVKFLQSTFTKASLGVDKSQPQSVKEFHAEVCNTSSANFQVPTELPIQQSTALFIYLWWRVYFLSKEV